MHVTYKNLTRDGTTEATCLLTYEQFKEVENALKNLSEWLERRYEMGVHMEEEIPAKYQMAAELVTWCSSRSLMRADIVIDHFLNDIEKFLVKKCQEIGFLDVKLTEPDASIKPVTEAAL